MVWLFINYRSNDVAHELRTFHLFAGGGGGLLADLLLGHVPVGACEIAEYPRRVLLQRQRDGILPAFPIWDDITTLDGKPWRGLIDVVAGGWPCTNICAPGDGTGLDGEKSGLWREMHRVINEVRPLYAFLENSPLLVGRGLDRVIADLSKIGYDLRWTVLGSDDIGGAHHRKRFWGVATDSMRIRQQGPWRYDKRLHPTQEDDRETDWFKHVLQGRTVPCVCGEDHGMDNGMGRLEAAGNGQDPRVAALAWQILTNTKEA
jgi:DNA (cytosine-5)-methyltransferase 1